MFKNNKLLGFVTAIMWGLFISFSAVSKSEACFPCPISPLGESRVKTDKMILKIEGMTCQKCVKKVNNSLRDIEGIKKVAVNLQNGEAIVEYEKDNVSKEEIMKTVEKTGFNVEVKP